MAPRPRLAAAASASRRQAEPPPQPQPAATSPDKDEEDDLEVAFDDDMRDVASVTRRAVLIAVIVMLSLLAAWLFMRKGDDGGRATKRSGRKSAAPNRGSKDRAVDGAEAESAEADGDAENADEVAPTTKRKKGPPPSAAPTTRPPTTPLPSGQCACPKSCLEFDCGSITTAIDAHNISGKSASLNSRIAAEFDAAPLLPSSIQFARCTACHGEGDRCGVNPTDEQCNQAQKELAAKVKRCLVPELHPPALFTVSRDAFSGYDVVCRGDAALTDCQGLGFAALRDTLMVERIIEDLLGKNAAEDEEQTDEELSAKKQQSKKKKEQNGKNGGESDFEKPIVFLDVGANDPFLDMRLASMPQVSVKVYSMVAEANNVVQISKCLNDLPESSMSVTSGSIDSASREHPNLAPGTRPPGTAKLVLRVNLPGYVNSVKSLLATTMSESKPALVITGVGSSHKDTMDLGSWLIGMGYTGFQQSSCSFIKDKDALGSLALTLRKGDTLQWVHQIRADRHLHPQCPHACSRLSCVDSWRTEYQPCKRGDYCHADERMPCDWKMSSMSGSSSACPADQNWATVQRCLDPLLPVAKFSIVAQFDMLVACRGASTCDGVDVVSCNSDTVLLVDLLKELSTRGDKEAKDVHFVFVGPYAGITGFRVGMAAGKHDGNHFVHMFDVNPATRQWQKATKCFNNIGRAVVYDFAIGERDEQCSVPLADTSALGEQVEIRCPAPRMPEAQNEGFIVSQFHTLDSVLGLWTSGDAGAEEGAAGDNMVTPRKYVMFFDGNIHHAGKLLQRAVLWLNDHRWQPAAVVLGRGASQETAKECADVLNRFHYASSVPLDGISTLDAPGNSLPRKGADGYVFLAPKHHHHHGGSHPSDQGNHAVGEEGSEPATTTKAKKKKTSAAAGGGGKTKKPTVDGDKPKKKKAPATTKKKKSVKTVLDHD